MKTFEIHLLGTLIILAGLTTSNAEVDCTQPPPYTDLGKCCQISDVITEEIKTKCETESTSNMPAMDEEAGPHHQFQCFISCVLNETGILVDGVFQEDNMTAYLNQVYDDSKIADFIGEQFRKCNKKRENIAPRQAQNTHDTLHCPHYYGHMLIGCAYIHAFKHCPDSVWTNTHECNAALEYMRECKPPHHPNNAEDDDLNEPFEEKDVEVGTEK